MKGIFIKPSVAETSNRRFFYGMLISGYRGSVWDFGLGTHLNRPVLSPRKDEIGKSAFE